VACDLNFIVKREGFLKVTNSHVHYNDLECPWMSFPYCKPFKCDISYSWHVVRFLCICRASCDTHVI